MNDTATFKALLEMLVPQLTNTVMEKRGLSEHDALEILYTSRLYQKLEAEETKLWHLSVPTLLELLTEELDTGIVTYPEEV